MNKRILLFTGGLSLLVLAIGTYLVKQKNLLKNFRWEMAGVQVTKFSLDNVSINFKIKFISDADLEAQVKALYLNIAMEGKNIGYITDIEPFIIPAHGFSYIDLNINFNPGLIFGNAVGIILAVTGNKDLTITYDGYATIKSGWISTTLPLNYSTSIKNLIK